MMQDRARGRRLFMLMRSGGWWVAGLVVSAAVAGALRADEPLAVRIDALMEARRFAEARPLLEQWTDELSRQPGANDPLAEARARHVLGSVLDRLGNPEAAVREFEKALQLYDRGGASPAERGAAWDEAGRAAQGAGRFEQAVTWLEEAAVARSGDPVRAAGSRAQRADALTSWAGWTKRRLNCGKPASWRAMMLGRSGRWRDNGGCWRRRPAGWSRRWDILTRRLDGLGSWGRRRSRSSPR